LAVYRIFGVKPSNFQYVLSAALSPVPMYIAGFTFNPNVQTLNFEYDGSSDSIQVSSAIDGTISLGAYNTDFIEKVAGAAAITSGLGAGIAKMWHPETGTYPFVQGELNIRVQDVGSGAEGTLRAIVWKMKLQNPYALGNVGNLEANKQDLAWSSTLTQTDILGATIPGLSGSQKVHYSIAQLS
jgi:hypothetical protein